MNKDMLVIGALGILIGFALTPVIRKYYVQPVVIQKETKEGKTVKTSPPLLGTYDEKGRLEKIHSLYSDSWSSWILFNERYKSTTEGGEGTGKGRDYRHNYTIV